MSNKLKMIFLIQSVMAFTIIVLLNYYALNLSIGWSVLGGLAFILVVGGWAAFRLKRYREKLQKKEEKKTDAGNHDP